MGRVRGPEACWPLAQLILVHSVALCRLRSGDVRTAHILTQGADVEPDLQLHGRCASGRLDCSSSPPIMTACCQPASKACPAYLAKSGSTLK